MDSPPEKDTQVKEKSDPELYAKESKYFKESVNENMMSTRCFMKEIDVRCDDHLSKFKEDVQATRYCSQCKMLCCDSCVIEYHNDHIGAAKTKIEDYFRSQKLELEDLRAKINNAVRFKVNIDEIDGIVDKQNQIVKSFFERRTNTLEVMKKKIDAVLENEKEIEAQIKDAIKVFYKDECYNRLDKPLKDNEKLLDKIQNFLKSWESYSKTEKVSALKADNISLFKSESESIAERVVKNTNSFKSKSITVENKIEELLKSIAFPGEISQFDKVIDEINAKNIHARQEISKLQYDDIVEAKLESLNKKQPQGFYQDDDLNSKKLKMFSNNPKEQKDVGNMYQNMYQIHDGFQNKSKYFQQNEKLPGFSQFQPVESYALGTSEKLRLMNNSNDASVNEANFTFLKNEDQMPNVQNSMNYNLDYQKYSEPQKANKQWDDFRYFISPKPRTDQLVIYDPSRGFNSCPITKANFESEKESFVTFPENSKFVNIGSSILLTGGYIDKKISSNCYLIVVSKDSPESQYEINILSYSKMIEPRERHNMIYLPDKTIVLCCSGFFNVSCEYTNISSRGWERCGKLNEVRGNATIAYVNQRYVYVIGGYKIPEKQNDQGTYHGNCEYLDFMDMDKGWKIINFPCNRIKYCAMGVVPIDSQSFYLCGGYDGAQYRKEVYRVDASDPSDPKLFQVSDMELPGNYIFLHSDFAVINGNAYNLELSFSVIKFNYSKLSFEVAASLNLN